MKLKADENNFKTFCSYNYTTKAVRYCVSPHVQGGSSVGSEVLGGMSTPKMLFFIPDLRIKKMRYVSFSFTFFPPQFSLIIGLGME